MARRKSKYQDVDWVDRKTVSGTYRYARARIRFPKDIRTGITPRPIDFYGKTEEIAVAKRDAYVPLTKPKTKESAQRLADYMLGEFTEDQELRVDGGHLGYNRFKQRKSRIERFIVPADLGQTVVSAIEPDDVEAFFKDLGVRKVSPDNQSDLREDLRLALRSLKQTSLRCEWRAYFDFRKYALPTITAKEKVLFDPELIFTVIFDETKPLAHRTLVAFQTFVFCRPQDMWALQWPDIDFELGMVSLTKSVKKTKTGWQVMAGGKTGAKGARSVPVAASLLDMLLRLRGPSDRQGFVFTTERGLPVHKDRMGRFWPAVKRSLGLPDGPTLYSLKSMANSLGDRNQISDTVRAKLAGHTTTRMVQTAYRIVDSAEVVAAVDRMDTLARRTGQRNVATSVANA